MKTSQGTSLCALRGSLACIAAAVTLACAGAAFTIGHNDNAAAGGGCGDPDAGSCFVPHGTPYCDDAKCCETVCNVDPYCCDVEWDFLCVDQANDLCDGGSGCAPSCGKQNVECLGSIPEQENSRAVGQLLRNGTTWCTVWIVAEPNIVMTNWHCVEGDPAGIFDVRFNFECENCDGSGGVKTTDTYDVLEIVHMDQSLDYAILRLSGNPAATWGVTTVDPSAPVVGTNIYEIHHGDGLVKGVDSGQITSVDIPGVCIPGTQAEIGVNEIATGGASGAPILSSDSHCVVGICHCGPPCSPGWGIPMSYIWPEALPHILDAGGTPNPTCGSDPKCPADIAGDDLMVNTQDLLALLANWGTDGPGSDIAAPLNAVDTADLLGLLSAWGPCD